ncbi:MAG: TRAP transporter large permease [Chloroflexota bacterium]|nr:TRAP transporter large permease [Chloroflexota bacterium]
MSIAFALLLLVFITAFLIRIPLAYGMMAAGIVYLVASGTDLGLFAQVTMNGYYSKFVLLAVPLFIFMAQIMNDSTVTEKIFHFAHAIVGRMPGGLAQVNVVNSVIFSGMSGSAVADASGTGLVEIKAMANGGYPKDFACATTAATSTIGPIIPPSIPMVIYAYLSATSVGMLFAAGMVPGLLLAGMQMVLIHYLAKRRGYPRERWPGLGQTLGRFLVAAPALMTPVILLGGIYSGVFTPTEAAAVASLYALLLAFVVYRAMGWSEFYSMFQTTVRQSATVGLIVGGAFIINYAVAVEGIPRAFADAILSLSNDPLVLLILINLLFLAMGMFLDTMVLLLIMVPVVLPVMRLVGIDPVFFGVVIVLNMMIGLSTPPFGVLLFIVSSTTGTPLQDVIRQIWPFLTIMIVSLIVLILFPDIVLFVPRLMGYGG